MVSATFAKPIKLELLGICHSYSQEGDESKAFPVGCLWDPGLISLGPPGGPLYVPQYAFGSLK